VVLFVASFLLAFIDLHDGQPGLLSAAFVLNYLTFLIVSFPYLDQIKTADILLGGWKVFRYNVVNAMTSLNKKHLGTFIHTR
jgi:threonine/homoserine/homoserine lactone efflux protein